MNSDILPILLLAGGVLLAGIILLTIIGRGQHRKTLNTEWYKQQWGSIMRQSDDSAAGRQLAIINADKLLDKAMIERGFKGQNMGERLKRHAQAFSGLNDVWSAHKLRNRVAHESDVNISEGDARRALAGLERGLKDLGALR